MIYVCTVVSSGVYVYVSAVKFSRTVSLSDKKNKQKTAYEIGVRLVGSEMCIRDR